MKRIKKMKRRKTYSVTKHRLHACIIKSTTIYRSNSMQHACLYNKSRAIYRITCEHAVVREWKKIESWAETAYLDELKLCGPKQSIGLNWR